MENTVLLPNEHLDALSKKYPGAWLMLDKLRADRGKDLPKWPLWCLLPMTGWYAIACDGNKTSALSLSQVADVSRLSAIGAWRYSQGIYRFDDVVYTALKQTVPNGDLPCDVLYRLPEWSIYIETPNHDWLGSPLHGFWCHLEWDANTERHELRLLLHTEQLIPIPLHLGKWTLSEAVSRAVSVAQKQGAKARIDVSFDAFGERLSESLYGLISLILYLCSDEPEIDDEREPGVSPKRPLPKKVRKGWSLFPADKPRVWTIGKTLGSTLRQAGQGSGKSDTHTKRPHLRRAHWHGFWSGPREGARTFHYHWLPPTVVACHIE